VDAFQRLREDHAGVLERLEDLERASNTGMGPAGSIREPAVRELIEHLERQFATHMRSEEDVLFPVLARTLPMASVTLGPLEAEHAELRQMLGDLSALLDSPAGMVRDGRVRVELRDFVDLLRLHIQKEEATVFAVASRVLATAELETLAARLGVPPNDSRDSFRRTSA